MAWNSLMPSTLSGGNCCENKDSCHVEPTSNGSPPLGSQHQASKEEHSAMRLAFCPGEVKASHRLFSWPWSLAAVCSASDPAPM